MRLTEGPAYMSNGIIFTANHHRERDAQPATVSHPQFELFSLESNAALQFMDDHEARRLDLFEVLWCKSATGTVQADSGVRDVEPQQLFILAPGQLRRFQLQPGATGYYLRFSPDFLYVTSHLKEIAGLLEQHHMNMQALTLDVHRELQEDLEDVVRKMKREYYGSQRMRSELLTELLSMMMIYVSRGLDAIAPSPVVTREGELTIRFRHLLKKKFLTKKKVSDYASELLVTPNYLNTSVKKVTGFTASHHIQQQIINEAKRQLISSNGSMKEIAFYLGFDNIAHFSKYFKAKTGVNFTSFRNGLEVAR
ncbi:helix-turn-helix transcriptional regulator [Chitinophaga horti]|uniref:Helix-turn-helix transcriptional regulator n=1 Tax=Chitinophaga horti TaxID=2920382 RepID=A0ABY6J6K2_9BACT|nr:helix-turn-helix transcriptional regulator [Chitinophaga horti]UYQ93789.1 helix-turn-helix transcriptional regulator [Chitinophaga horti]